MVLRFALLCGIVLGHALRAAAGPAVLEVSAGGHDRDGTPVRWEAPEGWKAEGAWRLVRAADEKEVPVQLEARERPAFVWLLEEKLPRGEKRKYRLEQRAPKSAPQVEVKDIDSKHLLLTFKGKQIIRYNYGVVEPPAGYGPEYARSGYIHPVWSPSGRMISNDYPPNHKHHHGIWSPWTKTEFEGRHVDFWNSVEKQGKVECTGVEEKISGPVFGGFRARHRFLDLTAPGGPKPVLNEVWEVKVYAIADYFLIDFLSVQECAGESPLVLKEYRYGGFGFRGAGDWEGKEGCAFLTSEGKTRVDGHATAARWCEMNGKVAGSVEGIGFLCHPSNFRAPQPMRIHDSEPFFNFTPCQAGDFEIVPKKPYVSRYRLYIHDGAAGAADLERVWQDYADPPKVKRVEGG